MKNIHNVTRAGRLAVAGLLLLAAGASQAVTLTQDGNFKLIEPPQATSVAPSKVEVVEVFWYACGHCFIIQPKVENWARTGKAPYVELTRMPATWNETLKTHARLFYTVELLGKPQLHNEIFREINIKRNMLNTPELIAAFFVAHGVPEASFQKVFSSFAVESKLRRAEDMNRRYKITGTPTFVVNGKYWTDVGLSGSEDKLFEVLNALAARDKPKG